MKRKKITTIFMFLFFLSVAFSYSIKEYRNLAQVKTHLNQLKSKYPFLKLKTIKGTELFYIEIGKSKAPAIFIGANISGYKLDSTEIALSLLEYIAERVKRGDKILYEKKFFIFPVLNPEVYKQLFKKPISEVKITLTPVDDDGDGLVDEDPPEDLNGDGYITIMRVKSPDGEYIEDKNFPYKMVKADPLKGEEGLYKVFIEGVDNDNDGEYNEDPRGGVILNNNFPILFKYYRKKSGLYPTSEKNVRQLLYFITEHPEIEIAFLIDKYNNLLKLPEVGRTQKVGDIKVKIPKRFAKFMGFDPKKEYSISEIVKALNESGFGGRSGMKITAEMVASFLGIAPPASFNSEDRKYYEELSEEYKKLLKEYKISDKRNVKGMEDGSLEKWLYFTLGILPFDFDSWSLPEVKKEKRTSDGLTVEKLKKMSKEEFLKLPDESLDKFFSQYKLPQGFKISMIKKMVEMGRLTPERMAKFIEKFAKPKDSKNSKYSSLKLWIEKELKGYGIIEWKKYNHPQLGEVEIGGVVPFIGEIPPIKKLKPYKELVNTMIYRIIEKMPKLRVSQPKVIEIDKDIYKISFFIENEGYLPFFTKMRERTRSGLPIIVDVSLPKGAKFLEGKNKFFVKSLYGKGSAKKIEFKIFSKNKGKVKLKISNPFIKTIFVDLSLGGVK